MYNCVADVYLDGLADAPPLQTSSAAAAASATAPTSSAPPTRTHPAASAAKVANDDSVNFLLVEGKELLAAVVQSPFLRVLFWGFVEACAGRVLFVYFILSHVSTS